MSRLHVSLYVPEMEVGIRYYSALFGAEPSRVEDAYAQWLLDDPSVNFVIEQSSTNTGLNHLGVQAGTEEELQQVFERFDSTGGELSGRDKTQCCYAVSEKGWARDPAGVAWEGFYTHEHVAEYGDPGDFTALPDNEARNREKNGGCC